MTSWSQGSPPRELIGGDGQNHEDAGDQDLIHRRHAHEREAIAEHADDERTDQTAEDRRRGRRTGWFPPAPRP